MDSSLMIFYSFWLNSAKLANANAEKACLQKSIKLRELEAAGEDTNEWLNSPEASAYTESQKIFQIEEKICKQQAQSLLNIKKEPRGKSRRVFLALFTSSTKGLKIKETGEGKRDDNDQTKFRKDLLLRYNLEKPNTPKKNIIWDVILGDWIQASEATAAHLFAYSHGLDLMEEIFGENSQQDMFKACNGLMLYSPIERKMDAGFFIIVPDLEDNPTQAQVQQWNATEPKEFKIRILVDDTHPDLDCTIRTPNTTTWRDLNGKRLEFPKNCNYRPKARYLYYIYCNQILRRSFHETPRGQTLKKELNKVYWGTPGRCMAGAMLKALVEEMGGQGWECLMQGAIENPKDISQSDPTLIQLELINTKKKADKQQGEDSESESDND
jgi:hypothetical protein